MVSSCLFFYPRYNLDARGEHDDEALWEALEIAQLKGVVSELDLKLGKKIRSYVRNENRHLSFLHWCSLYRLNNCCCIYEIFAFCNRCDGDWRRREFQRWSEAALLLGSCLLEEDSHPCHGRGHCIHRLGNGRFRSQVKWEVGGGVEREEQINSLFLLEKDLSPCQDDRGRCIY